MFLLVGVLGGDCRSVVGSWFFFGAMGQVCVITVLKRLLFHAMFDSWCVDCVVVCVHAHFDGCVTVSHCFFFFCFF